METPAERIPGTRIRSGRLVAELFSGSWRATVEPARLSASDLADIAPLILGSGGAPLAFRRARAHEDFQQAFRISKLLSVVREEQTLAAFEFLRSRGVAPLVIKGLVAARLYPDPACRPYGDVDVCVSPDHYEAAGAAVREAPPGVGAIDVHRPPSRLAIRGRSLLKVADDFQELADRDWDDVVARSTPIPVAGGEIRVPCAEDHLRVLALHYLRHGGFRPLWLCDISAALEGRPADFDWDRAFSGDPWRSRCLSAALLLAHELLGANLDGVPRSELSRTPRWMIPAVLREWERPDRWPAGRPLIGRTLLQRPAAFFREAVRRWPGPLESTINLRGPINDFPRFPLQLIQLVRRLPVIPSQVAVEIRNRLAGPGGRAVRVLP